MAARLSDIAEHNDPVKAWIHSNVPLFVRELLAGGTAGAIAKTSVAPFERTKILLMTGKFQTTPYQTLRTIIATEGVRGMFRGNAASCLRIMPYAAIHFSVYESYRRLLADYLLPPVPSTPSVLNTGTSHGGGGGGAAAAAADSGGSYAEEDRVEEAAHVHVAMPSPVLTSSIEVSAATAITSAEESEEEAEAEEQAQASLAAASGRQSTQAASTSASQGQWQHHQQQHPHHQNHHQHAHHHHHHRPRLGPLGDLLAGSAAGATAVLITYPLDVVRTRMAWATDAVVPGGATGGAAPAPAYQTRIVPMLTHTARHEGMRGLYRGLLPTLYGIMPYAGLKFYMYSLLKQWYRESPLQHQAGGGGHGRSGHAERLPVSYMLLFGGISGLLAQTVTYPLDVVRRRMQVAGLQEEMAGAGAAGPGRLTMWGTTVAIAQQEGWRGFVRGMSINYVKVVPCTAIGFTAYELLKSYLGVTGNL